MYGVKFIISKTERRVDLDEDYFRKVPQFYSSVDPILLESTFIYSKLESFSLLNTLRHSSSDIYFIVTRALHL